MQRNVLRVILVSVCYFGLVTSDSDLSETIENTKQVFDTVTEVTSSIGELVNSVNPGQVFKTISTALGSLGPVAMVFTSFLSFFQLLLGPSESPEMKAIREGFEKLNNRLDGILFKLDSLQNVIEFAAARAEFSSSLNAINENYERLQHTQKYKSQQFVNNFITEYDKGYVSAASRWHNSMMGSQGTLGFDAVKLYREHIKCNPTLLSQFCSIGIQHIIKGVMVEGAYLGYRKLTEVAKVQSADWKTKIESIGNKCSAEIQYCQDNWERYANQQFQETYSAVMGKITNQEFATRVIDDLKSMSPLRNWMTIIHNDATDNNESKQFTNYHAFKRWNELGHDVTVYSVPKSQRLDRREFDNVKYQIREYFYKLSGKAACTKSPRGRHWRIDIANMIASDIWDIAKTGVVYIIQNDHDPVVAGSGGIMYPYNLNCYGIGFKSYFYQ